MTDFNTFKEKLQEFSFLYLARDDEIENFIDYVMYCMDEMNKKREADGIPLLTENNRNLYLDNDGVRFTATIYEDSKPVATIASQDAKEFEETFIHAAFPDYYKREEW